MASVGQVVDKPIRDVPVGPGHEGTPRGENRLAAFFSPKKRI